MPAAKKSPPKAKTTEDYKKRANTQAASAAPRSGVGSLPSNEQYSSRSGYATVKPSKANPDGLKAPATATRAPRKITPATKKINMATAARKSGRK